jgi:hypothetical protein
VLLATCALVAINSAVGAQPASISPQLTQFLQSKFNREAVQQAVKNQVASWPGACTALTFDSKFDVSVLQPVQFSTDGRSLVSGMWREAFDATACGVTRRHNILSVVANNGVHRIPMLVGSSRADVMLQRDAAPYLFAGAAKLASADCKSNYVTDTRFIGFDGPAVPNAKAGPNARPWREEWTLWSCEKKIVVPIKFSPDSTGTKIIVDQAGVRLN